MALCLGDLMEGVLKAKRLIAFVEDMLAVDWDGESPSVITGPLNKTCREFQVPLWLLLNYYQRTCAERFRCQCTEVHIQFRVQEGPDSLNMGKVL